MFATDTPCRVGSDDPIAAAIVLLILFRKGVLIPAGLSPIKVAATALGEGVPAGALTGIAMV